MEAPRSRKRTKAGVYVSSIGLQELASVFHLPSNQASEALGVGLTIFKRLCRKYGLNRWPYRALKKQGKLLQQGKAVPPEELERIIQDCQVPLPWQPPGDAALPPLPALSLQQLQLQAAAHAGPARAPRASRRRGGVSASASDLATSGEEDEQRGSRRARGGSSSDDSGGQWLPAAGSGDAAMAGQPELNALLAAAGLAGASTAQLVKPQPRPADAGSLEQLQQTLLTMQQQQQHEQQQLLLPPVPAQPQPQQLAALFGPAPGPSPPPGLQAVVQASDGALPALLAAFSAVPAGDRQQVAGLLQQLAEVLQQEARSAAAAALLSRLQAPPAATHEAPAAAPQQHGALDVVRQLEQLCGGGSPLQAAPVPAPAPDVRDLLAGLLGLPGSSGSGGPAAPPAPTARALSAPPTVPELPVGLAEQLRAIQDLTTVPVPRAPSAPAQTAAT